jgi:hypothetical protein
MNTPTITQTQGNEELTIIQNIRVEDIRESFPKGKAEVVAIVSGIGLDGAPKLDVRSLPFLTKAGELRTPNMDIVNWTQFASKYVNIEFWELDGDLDFNYLVRGLVDSIGDIRELVAPGAIKPGTPAAEAEQLMAIVTARSKAAVSVITKLSEAVLKTMGSGSWLKDDHDYLDTFYTIERGEYYRDRLGANRNVRMTLKVQ